MTLILALSNHFRIVCPYISTVLYKYYKTMVLDLSDPRNVEFLLESYEKENLLRLRWTKKHEEIISKAAQFSGPLKNYKPDDVNRSLMVAGMAALTRDYVAGARLRMVAPIKDYPRVKVDTAKLSEPPMMPVKIDDKDVLRNSRREYLKTRSKKLPEDKYKFMECINWKYGWQLGQSESKMRGPVHGRVCHLLRGLQSHVGPQPDPDYYASPGRKSYFL